MVDTLLLASGGALQADVNVTAIGSRLLVQLSWMRRRVRSVLTSARSLCGYLLRGVFLFAAAYTWWALPAGLSWKFRGHVAPRLCLHDLSNLDDCWKLDAEIKGVRETWYRPSSYRVYTGRGESG